MQLSNHGTISEKLVRRLRSNARGTTDFFWLSGTEPGADPPDLKRQALEKEDEQLILLSERKVGSGPRRPSAKEIEKALAKGEEAVAAREAGEDPNDGKKKKTRKGKRGKKKSKGGGKGDANVKETVGSSSSSRKRPSSPPPPTHSVEHDHPTTDDDHPAPTSRGGARVPTSTALGDADALLHADKGDIPISIDALTDHDTDAALAQLSFGLRDLTIMSKVMNQQIRNQGVTLTRMHTKVDESHDQIRKARYRVKRT